MDNGHLNGHTPHRDIENEKSVSKPEVSGLGASFELDDPHRVRGDLALVRRAIRQRWGITDAQRKRAPEIAMAIAENSDDDRAKVGALGILRAMESDNQTDDHAEAGVGKKAAEVTVNVANVIKVEHDRLG